MLATTYKGYITYFLGVVVNLFLGFLILQLLATTLSQEQFGEYGFLISLSSILIIIANAGAKEEIYKSGIQKRNNSSELLSRHLIKVIVIAFLSCALLLINVTYFILSIYILAFSTLQLVNANNRGLGFLGLDVWGMPTQRMLFVALLLALSTFTKLDTANVFLLLTIACIVSIPLLTKTPFSLFKLKTIEKRNNKTLGTFFLIEVVSVSYLKLDILFGGQYIGSENLSVYYICLQIFEAALAFLIPVAYIFIRQLEHQKLLKVFTQYVLVVTILSLLGLIFNYIFMESILEYFFPEYLSVKEFSSLMIYSSFLAAINSFISIWLILNEEHLYYLKVCISALVLSIFIIPPLASTFGVFGLSISKIVVEIFIICLGLFKVWRAMLK
jgi:O-antigen/teichoic acid export membrane protein